MKKLGLVIISLLFLAGCGGYWMVTDPISKSVYYTDSIIESRGGIRFIDAKTGDDVTLQNSQVREIPKEEFKTAVGKK